MGAGTAADERWGFLVALLPRNDIGGVRSHGVTEGGYRYLWNVGDEKASSAPYWPHGGGNLLHCQRSPWR